MNEREIFDAALAIGDPGERSRFLDQACSADLPLREHLRGLIEAHDKLGGFLQQPLPMGCDVTAAQMPTYKAGALVAGRYKLLEQLGEGGMGAVWVAEQTEPVKRRVALKLIKPGMDSRQVLSRFEAERQALALMDHPNIARVFDGGMTDEGRPFFVMEYVKGVPITDFCDQARLPIADRLKLFVCVCQAVQHAHQKGIIHRDLKPSNILVCLYDGQPVPKVIDFGLAKAMHQSLTERTLYTAHGLMVGTPLYMSPEQAEFNNLDVDTRTDVYSLGVLLYELLTGSTPLEQRKFKDAAFAEILRLIKEEEPTKPSLKLSGSASLPSIAAQRGVEPAQLSRAVKGDLDWIVMKSLEKERSRRYETANGLARDIERFLADEPVEACPPSLRYRLRKVLRRHRGPAMAAALVFLALTAGIVGTTLGIFQANAERRRALVAENTAKQQAQAAEKAAAAEVRQRNRADEEAAAARAVRDFLQDDLLRQASLIHQVEVNSIYDDGSRFLRNPPINELLDRAAAELAPDKIEAKFPKLPLVQAEVLKAVGDAYAGCAPAKAIEPIKRSIELYRQSRGPDDPATLAARHSLGVALLTNRRDAEAAQELEAVLADRTRVLGPYHADSFATRDFLAGAYVGIKSPQAIPFLEQLAADARQHLGIDDIRTLKVRFHLGIALTYAGRIDEGIREMEAIMSRADQLKVRADHPYILSGCFETGVAYKKAGNFAKAVQMLEMALKLIQQDERETEFKWAIRHELGWCYLSADRRDESIAIFEKNLELAKPPQDVTSMEALGWAVRTVDSSRTIELYAKARKLRAERSGPDDPEALRVGQKQASLLRDFGKTSEALALLDEILPRLEKVHGRDHLTVLKAQVERARCLVSLKQAESADELFRNTVAQLEKSPGPHHLDTLEARNSWLIGMRDCGQYERVIEMADDLAAQWRAAGMPIRAADVLFQKGSNLIRVGRPAAGEPALRETLAIYLKETPQAWNTANCKYHLGAGLASQQKFAEAEQLLVAAFEEMTERIALTPTWGGGHRRLVAARLVKFYAEQNKSDEAARWQRQLDALAGPAPPSGTAPASVTSSSAGK